MKHSGVLRGLKGVTCRSLQPIVLNAFGVPATAYIIRRLGADGYGQWTIATSLVATTAAFCSLGLRGPFVREVARNPDAAPALLTEQLGSRLLLAAVTAALTLLAAVALGYRGAVVACTAVALVGLVLTTAATTEIDLLEAFGRLTAVAAASFIAGAVLTALSVGAAWLHPDPVTLSVAYLSGPLILVLLLARAAGRNLAAGISISLKRTARLLRDGRHFAVQQVAFTVSANMSLLMLPKLIGTDAFGLFSAGTLLVTRLAVVPDALGTAFFPGLAKSAVANPATFRKRAVVGLLTTVLLCGLISAVFWILSDEIARLLFFKTSEACRSIISITIWALPLIGAQTFLSYALNAAGCEADQARRSVVAAVLTIGAGAFILVRWSAPGACWFTLLRPGLQTAMLLPAFARLLVVTNRPSTQDASGLESLTGEFTRVTELAGA